MASDHSSPVEGATCMSCWEDLTSDLYVEYQGSADSAWMPSGYCKSCIQHMLNSQWEAYCSSLAKTTCKAEQKRLLTKGPPINISDKTALPCPDDGEVHALWFMDEPTVDQSAKLTGSLVGEARAKFWEEQKAFYIHDEPDEEDATAPSTAKSTGT